MSYIIHTVVHHLLQSNANLANNNINLDNQHEMLDFLKRTGYIDVYHLLVRLHHVTELIDRATVKGSQTSWPVIDRSLTEPIIPRKMTESMRELVNQARDNAWAAYRRLTARRDIEHYLKLRKIAIGISFGSKVDTERLTHASFEGKLSQSEAYDNGHVWARPLPPDELPIVQAIGDFSNSRLMIGSAQKQYSDEIEAFLHTERE